MVADTLHPAPSTLHSGAAAERAVKRSNDWTIQQSSEMWNMRGIRK